MRTRYRLLMIACYLVWSLVLLVGCNATGHRIHVGVGMLSDHTETLSPYVMYDREGRDDWHFQIGYHEYVQLALVKQINIMGAQTFVGLSYFPKSIPADVHCSQGNIRIGLRYEAEQFSVGAWHDSNMRVCKPNKGFNFLTAGYKFAKRKPSVSEQFGVKDGG